MHKTIYQDEVGCDTRKTGPFLKDCPDLPEVLKLALLNRLGNSCRLTPIQAQALNAGICHGNNHFLVSAPTNSGKTLVGLFRIFADILNKRGRCVYVAPLKALAEEKRIELEDLCEKIESFGGPKIKLSITTGDYQITNDFLGSPPPENGELIICTPERLEILLRSNENIYWARAVSAFIVDEFHLLGEHRRGATMEILLTRILVSCPWSRIVALSASMGGMEAIKEWLHKGGTSVQLLEDHWRYPVLKREVIESEEKGVFISGAVQDVLNNNERSLLVFVGKRNDADNLAKALRKEFKSNQETITSLHAGLTLKERHNRLIGLRELKNRVVVATTALKMGVDAPVTDVIIRDIFLWGQNGSGQLSYADMLQMMGRAGRRDIAGKAAVLCETNKADAIAQLFRRGVIENIEPQLIKAEKTKGQSNPVLSILLAEIVMKGKTTTDHLDKYLNHTFSCVRYETLQSRLHVNELVRLKLVYQEEDIPGVYLPSKLGKTIALTGISPESGALVAGFFRALIKLDEKFEEAKGRRFNYLKRLNDLDLIFLCCASFECRNALVKKPSKKAITDIQEFIETLPPEEKPIVNLWHHEDSPDYPTHRLLTSLRIPFDSKKRGQAEKTFYKLMQSAVLLYQHGKGTHLADLATKFKTSLGGLENNLKFNVLWILNCLSQICNPKRCYKLDYLMMRSIKLIECIAIGSELGELLTIKGVGKRTVEKVIENDIKTMKEIRNLSCQDLLAMNIGRKQSELIYQKTHKTFR